MSIIVCKQPHCFYQDRNFCARDIVILNENGACLSYNVAPPIENSNGIAIAPAPPKITIIEAKERKKEDK